MPEIKRQSKNKNDKAKALKCKRAIVFAAAFIIINTESFSYDFEILTEEF